MYKPVVFTPQLLMLATHKKNVIFFTLLAEYGETARDSRTRSFQHPSLQPTGSVSHKARPTLPCVTGRLPRALKWPGARDMISYGSNNSLLVNEKDCSG